MLSWPLQRFFGQRPWAKQLPGKRATRRRHSAQFKAEVLEACRQPDASAAAIARLYNLNANVVHRWRADDRKAAAPRPTDVPTLPVPDFIALEVQPEAKIPVRDIRIELKRDSASALVRWPVESASSCAAWLREWLR
jgi:transposase